VKRLMLPPRYCWPPRPRTPGAGPGLRSWGCAPLNSPGWSHPRVPPAAAPDALFATRAFESLRWCRTSRTTFLFGCPTRIITCPPPAGRRLSLSEVIACVPSSLLRSRSPRSELARPSRY